MTCACGAARVSATDATETAERPREELRCGPTEARLGDRCFAVEGTRWWFVTDLPVGGHREFELVLAPGGRAEVGDPVDTTPDNDGWSQSGTQVTITMNDRFVTYSATLTDDRVLRGRGLNVNGLKWDFVATRRP